VQLADPAKPLFLRVIAALAATAAAEDTEEEAQAVATPGARVVKSKKFDYVGAYRLRRPWLTKLSLTAILLIITLGVVGELVRPEKQKAFMPGGLSSAHARARTASGVAVAEDCDACHLPWKSVSSSKCLDCHPQQPHAEHELNAPDCFACHAEHRGALKLAQIPDTTCIGCHADLAAHVRLPRAQLVSLRFAGGRYAFDDIARIDAFGERHPELTYPRDTNTLRFNHKLHLAPRGVFNGEGKREILQCTGCHEMGGAPDASAGSAGKPAAEEAAAPLDFEKHCQRCHRLAFDARFPNAEVPHGGDNGIVYGFVLAQYSGDRDIVGKPPAEVRRILTARRTVNVDARALINAENVFKVRCRLCHEIQKRGQRLAVTPPVILTRWLTHAKFTHSRHRMAECESCHEGARESVPTSDILMPRRRDCTNCHAKNAKTMQAASTCLTCHEYHLRPQRPIVAATLAQAGMGGLGGEGRMLQGILLAVIVILLLVVLVPVGIALFQRLRPERAAAPRQSKSAPPPRPMPDVPTDRRPPRTAAPSPPPDIAAPKFEPVPVTRVDIPDRAEAASGTEMVQWYGMLNCTAGPLAGQRFVIEENGVYIGRDPALATIVIPDTRISKRHLRIVPRDGKVWAIDQSSTNGTFLGDERITEIQLKRGDTLILGDNAATFVYQI
jgi:hypothetical protein